MDEYSTMTKTKKVIKYLIMGIIMAVFVLGLSAIVMLIWNKVLTDITDVKEIKYWQALLLFILLKILFGSFRPGKFRKKMKRRKAWKEKWMNMDPDQRAEFQAKWREHCQKRKEQSES